IVPTAASASRWIDFSQRRFVLHHRLAVCNPSEHSDSDFVAVIGALMLCSHLSLPFPREPFSALLTICRYAYLHPRGAPLRSHDELPPDKRRPRQYLVYPQVFPSVTASSRILSNPLHGAAYRRPPERP